MCKAGVLRVSLLSLAWPQSGAGVTSGVLAPQTFLRAWATWILWWARVLKAVGMGQVSLTWSPRCALMLAHREGGGWR